MNPREAFKVFIRFQLHQAREEGNIDLTNEEIEEFALSVEDDPMFYEKMNVFLADYINDYREF